VTTTTFHLVRHGSHDRLNRMLCGRMEGVGLGDLGRAEAQVAASRLQGEPLAAVISSPLQRCQETAHALAAEHRLPVEEEAAFIELDFGDWTGLSFDELRRDPRFEPWNSRRTLNRPPGGESLGEAQIRAVRGLERLRERFPDGAVAIVSHSDVIKALVAHVLGSNLDLYHRFDVDPASLTTLVIGDWGARLTRLNVR
jgi:broad specificity phosphatase PhoE